jgi:hypothetical protein
MSWTQAVCDDCWDERNPDRLSPRRGSGYHETCCWCGGNTRSGIYDIRAIATEVCDLWDDDAVDDDAMSNLIVRLRKAIA